MYPTDPGKSGPAVYPDPVPWYGHRLRLYPGPRSFRARGISGAPGPPTFPRTTHRGGGRISERKCQGGVIWLYGSVCVCSPACRRVPFNAGPSPSRGVYLDSLRPVGGTKTETTRPAKYVRPLGSTKTGPNIRCIGRSVATNMDKFGRFISVRR